ncbi:MAG: TROVE domain-containing protein [Candidatus Lokiarchaeota archaeon]|nr:TROVE domain-containing protein [Candidatus Lokiarchaeota archaeon]
MPKKFKELDISPATYATADTKNKQNFPAWKMNDEDRLIQLLHTGRLEKVYYAGKHEMTREAVELLERAPVDLLEKWVPIARNDGFMRTMPILALTILSEKDIKTAQRIFNDVIRTGNDLSDFMDARQARGRGFGRGIKRAIKEWLKVKLSEFYAIKYGNEVVRGIRVSRPSEEDIDDTSFKIIQYLMRKYDNKWKDEEYEIPPELEKLQAFEEIKQIDPTDLDNVERLIKKGRLDYSVLSMLPKSPELWKIMMRQMGVFALLRHLATFERHDLDKDDEVYDFLLGKDGRISAENLLKAKVFPFRVFQAFQQITSTRFRNGLASVMEEFLPKYDFTNWGRVAVCPDVSGSMTLNFNKSSLAYIDIAALFGVVLYKGIEESDIFPWSTSLYTAPPKNDSIISMTEAVKRTGGGGTFMELPLKYMLNGHIDGQSAHGYNRSLAVRGTKRPKRWNRLQFDTLIWITDTIEFGDGWLGWWKTYKRKFPMAKAILIRIDSYDSQPFPEDVREEYDIIQIFGWNNSVLDYIDYVLNKE